MNDSDEKLIERLRTSKQAALAEAYSNRQDCGRKWGEENAEWGELTRLVKLRDRECQQR